jgi:hypothetical protein
MEEKMVDGITKLKLAVKNLTVGREIDLHGLVFFCWNGNEVVGPKNARKF